MATPFESFVNDELPKRPSTRQDPLTLAAGLIAVSVGNGLEVEFRNPADFIADGKSAYDLAVEGGFEGTVEEWLLSLVGPEGKNAFQVAQAEGFEGTVQEWLTSLKGEDAYQIAVANGFVGDQAAWLESLKGLKGDQGEKGDAATLTVLGYLDSTEQLPDATELENGLAYYIEKHIWVVYNGAWVDAGDQSGPAGQDGIGIRILGTLPGTAWLPSIGNESGDAYIITSKMYVWDTERWSPVGQVGPQGLSAFQVAQQQGFTGNVNQWLASLVGKTNYQIARANGYTGTESEWLATLIGPRGDKGERGDKGDQGDPGTSAAVVVLKGAVATEQDLPAGAAVSDAYLIGTQLYVWIGDSWANVGNVVGPQGLKGDKGDRGDQGVKGDVGLSAYQLAMALGFVGSQEEWMASLVGPDGRTAYEIAVAHGFVGSETEWVASLKGEDGIQGPRGLPGTGLKISGKVDTPAQLPGTAAEDECWVVDRNVYCYIDSAWVDLGLWVGDKGDVGPEGPPGPPLEYKGTLNSEAEMQAIPNPQEGFLVAIGKHFWVYNGTAWVDCGDFSGPKGDKGDRGDQGLQGDRGEKGDQGIQGPDGEQGLMGPGVKILGKFDTPAQLPATADALGDGYLIAGHFWGWTGSAFEDLGPVQGPQGVKGNKGDKGDTGSKGDKGDRGEKGDMGPALTLLGKVNDQSELPLTGNLGDGYLIGTHFWGWTGTQWEDLGVVQGPKGDQGDQGEVGPIGPGITAKGTLPDLDALNDLSDPQPGDAYTVSQHLYVRAGTAWVDLGDLKGERGEQGLQGEQGLKGDTGAPILPRGNVDEVTDLPDAATEGAGATYLVGMGQVYISDGNNWVFMGVIVGPQGPEGPMGPGITILGKLNNESELPGTADLGQGYLINGDFWGWTGAAFENLGPIQGPQGIQGVQGKQGIQGVQGNKGDKGDQGSLWVVLGRDPQPIDGRIGDYFLNSSTLQFFRKNTSVLWAPLGYMGGGNVYDAPADSNEYSRIDGGWKKIDVLEALKDGKMYVRKDGAWAELTIDVTEAPEDGKLYGRVNGGWVEIVIPTFTLPGGTDGFEYIAKNGAWAKLDRYTLKIGSTTAALDLADRQTFTVDASTNRTLTFSNAPGAGRSMTVVITVAGNAGQITWPAGIQWNAGTAPALGATFTVVVLFWNGTNWYGSTGATA